MNTQKEITKFENRFLVYSFKNILRESAFMFVVMWIGAMYNSAIDWKWILFMIVSSIGYGFVNIAIQRHYHKKGKLYIPKDPKFIDKTWEEHQADK